MREMDLSQMKFFFISGVTVILIIAPWLWVVLPIEHRSIKLQQELQEVQSRIRKIESLVEKGQSLKETTVLLEERYRRVSSQFPAQEEESLELLSNFAQQRYLKILSVRAQPKTDFWDEDRRKLEIEGKVLQKISVSMEMRGFYKTLINYITAIKEELPAYVMIEKLSLRKEDSSSMSLDILLEITLYLLA